MKLRHFLIAIVFGLCTQQISAQVAGPVEVGFDEYAFTYTPSPLIGLFFSGTDQQYEFRDAAGDYSVFIRPQTNTTYVKGRLGINTESPTTGLDVNGTATIGDGINAANFNSEGDLEFSGTANYLVPGNSYAFRAKGAENIGLYFNQTDQIFEFRDGSASPVMSLGANNGTLRLQDGGVTKLNYNGSNLTINELGVSSGLTLNGSDITTQVRVRLNNINDGGRNWIMQSSSNGTPVGGGKFSIRDEFASSNRFVIDTLGNFGFNSEDPEAMLDVDGTIKIGNSGENVAGAIRWTGSQFQGYDGSAWNNFVSSTTSNWILSGTNVRLSPTTNNVAIGLTTPSATLQVNSEAGEDAFRVQVNNSTKIKVNANGGTSIGVNNSSFDAPVNGLYIEGEVHIGNGARGGSTGYKMAVDGEVICEGVTVQLSGSWPDYVFTPEHKMPSLPELKNQIESIGHLPGMPSASEVEADGVDIAEVQKKLLEKVEELTLYLIEANEEIQDLRTEVATLKNN